MIKITGLDSFTRDIKEAERALRNLDGELGVVKFDPNDPSSIEAAIMEVEKLIDDRLGSFRTNPIIAPLIDGMKEQYREGIIQRASSARLGESEDG